MVDYGRFQQQQRVSLKRHALSGLSIGRPTNWDNSSNVNNGGSIAFGNKSG